MAGAQRTAVVLIVGLGNPGDEYARTRHNAGFWFVDALAGARGGEFRRENRFHGLLCRVNLSGHECWLLKPETYMNRSGQSVVAVAAYYKIAAADILVVHDDLDLSPGTVRLKQGGGHGGHNGLRDIVSHLGPDFLRMRIGIGHPGSSRDVTDYVLSRASAAEHSLIEAAIEDALAALPLVIAGELQKAMTQLHSKV